MQRKAISERYRREFNIKLYLDDSTHLASSLEKKTKELGKGERMMESSKKREIESNIRHSSLTTRFLEINEEALNKENPETDTMKQPCSWIIKEGNCVTGDSKEQLKKINELTEMRLWAEQHFSKFAYLKKETQKESICAGKSLQKNGNKIALASSKSSLAIGPSGLKAEKEKTMRP